MDTIAKGQYRTSAFNVVSPALASMPSHHCWAQMWEEDAEHFAHAMGTEDPFRSKAEALLLTLLEVSNQTAIFKACHGLFLSPLCEAGIGSC